MKARLPITAIMLAGCAVQGAPFERAEAPPGNATIYVYRPYNYGGSLLKPAVTCGDDTARIGPGGYHAFIVPAGQPIVCHVAQETTDEVEFDGVLSGHPHLNPIDNDKAQAEISKCCVKQDSVDSTSTKPP
jgi:hypothetical protein